MNEIIKLILSLSLSGSILAVIIFAIKPLVKNKLSKSIQYYIWIVVLLRLLLPFSFETSIMNNVFYSNDIMEADTPAEIQSPAEAVDNVDTSAIEGEILDGAATVLTESTANKADLIVQFKDNLIYIWLLGALIAFSANVFGYVRFIKALKKANRPAKSEEIEMLSQLLGRNKRASIMRNKYAATPMLTGILKPCIIIPDISFTGEQLRNILLHEITHLRRFDLGVKWATVVAASIHWFNPLMHFVKKEINNACELSCDEGVIKNLNDEEKQHYGDTLISMVAEHKYPVGILSTTMCEEKKTLKDRLISIMNHSKKSRLVTVVSVVLIITVICTSVVLGAGIGFGNRRPPDIYISTEFQSTRDAIKGGYSWKVGRQNILADAAHPIDFKYTIENIVSVNSGEQLIISTQNQKADKKYSFSIESMEVYKDGKLYEFDSVKPSFMNGYLYLQAPEESGEYVYSLWLDFGNKGKVNYGFVVRVDMATYYLSEIEKYKTPYIGNHVKVGNIVSLLPVPDSRHFKHQYISLRTSKTPYILNVYYESKSEAGLAGVEWPISPSNSVVYSILQKNALVLFYMVDNLDEIVFAFRNTPSTGDLEASKYDSKFTFTRDGIEKIYGEQIFDLKDRNQLEDIINGKRISINSEIDKLLEEIMSSPAASSRTGDYISAHMAEYTEILKMSEDALPHLVDILNGGDSGLKGNIAWIICDDIVKKLNNSGNIDSETEKLVKEAQDAIDKWKSMMGYNIQEGSHIDPLPEFTEKEVASARAVVEEYYRAIAAKDDKAIFATLHESSRSDNVVLYGTEKRTLLSIDYNSQDLKRRNFRPNDPAFTPAKVIVFKVKFNIEYPKGEGGSWNEGIYDNWSMILIRENENSPWYIYDQGY